MIDRDCYDLISFVRTLDNGWSVFIELDQICLFLFARSTFSNYFTDERERERDVQVSVFD